MPELRLQLLPHLPAPLPLNIDQEYKDDRKDDDRHSNKRRHINRCDQQRIRNRIRITLRVRDPVTANQKSVRIHTIRRTGYQRTVILALFKLQIRQIRRIHDPDLIHFIGHRPVQHIDRPGVALGHFIKICKKPRARQTSVSGNHTVRRRTANRQRRSRQMADRDLQNRLIRSMIDRQRNIHLRHIDITHDTRVIHIQQRLVFRLLLFRHDP